MVYSIMSRLAVGGNVGERTVVSGSIEALLGRGNLRRSRPRTALQRLHLSSRSLSTYFAQARDTSSLEIATPILIPRDDGHKHRRGSHGDVIFLTNRGEVTSYTPDVHGREPLWQWQLQTEATWSNNLPSPFSLRIHDNQPMVIISPGGSVLSSIELPSQPTHALITDDFSNDGLADVIVMTPNGIYGFVQSSVLQFVGGMSLGGNGSYFRYSALKLR